MEFTDETLMPFGKHKGVKMANVPAQYLLFLYEQGNIVGHLKRYIEDNLTVIKEQAKEEAELFKKQ